MMQRLFKCPVDKPLVRMFVWTPMSLASYRLIHESVSLCIEASSNQVKRNAALKKYELTHLDLDWPENISGDIAVDYIKNNPQSISQMYGRSDLSKVPIFQGGFINFGYWPNHSLDKHCITKEQRVASAIEMYRIIGKQADIANKTVLEVGCGLGYGCQFLSNFYKTRYIVGIDASSEQISRARKHHAVDIRADKMFFLKNSAENISFVRQAFDRVISIEAAQHFSSMRAFSCESSRVLKPSGKLVMASFFATSKEGVTALNDIVPNYRIHGSQNTVEEVKNELSQYYSAVSVKSIGKNVWHGFSKWLDQIGYHHQWSKIWCALYEKQLIDYFVFEAQAPQVAVDLDNNPDITVGCKL